MNRKAIVTVATRNYMHFALALMKSAELHHPDTEFFICLADQPLQSLALEGSETNVFYAFDLNIPNWPRFAFQYDPFELSCALKPFAIQHLLDRGYDEIIFLDADMRLYNRLDAVFHGLEEYSIVLTPHLLRPFPRDGAFPGEDLFLAAGPFNAGFLAIRNDTSGNDFIDWWSGHLQADCYKDMANSIFVDQKWLSLVPGLFDNVLILRDPGYNTGHWTLPQFSLSTNTAGEPTIGNRPIVLFHFSNLNPNAPQEFSTCQSRMRLETMPVLQRLVAEYHAAIDSCNGHQYAAWGCAYANLSDGTPIHPAWREAIRRNHPRFDGVIDPFNVGANPQLKVNFAAVERPARKWRKDWRLKGIGSDHPQDTTKYLEHQLKGLLSRIGLRKKAA